MNLFSVYGSLDAFRTGTKAAHGTYTCRRSLYLGKCGVRAPIPIFTPAGWGGETPHPVPRRQVFCTAVGNYEITASDGHTRRHAPERVPLVEDTCGTGHSTQIIGEEGALIFAVVLAESQ